MAWLLSWNGKALRHAYCIIRNPDQQPPSAQTKGLHKYYCQDPHLSNDWLTQYVYRRIAAIQSSVYQQQNSSWTEWRWYETTKKKCYIF